MILCCGVVEVWRRVAVGNFLPAFHIRPFGPPSPREKAVRLRRRDGESVPYSSQ